MDLHPPAVACSSCHLRELCMPAGLSPDELTRLAGLASTSKRIPRGQALFRHGDRFTALYAVRTGFFKTCVSSAAGHEQVTGFQMAGELLGLDGIAEGQHCGTAIALEDSYVCVLPFERIETLTREFGVLQRQVHKLMSQELVRDQRIMLLLGSMRAEERLATFLLNLAQRQHSRGYSPSELVLRMTRGEIGSYLGLTLETVCRTIAKFVKQGVLEVDKRCLRIQRPEALRRLVDPLAVE